MHLSIGQLKMKSEQRRQFNTGVVSMFCTKKVLWQIFREMSLAIYRHNVNLKLTDGSAYKNLSSESMTQRHASCVFVMVLIFMKSTELGTCYIIFSRKHK